LDWLITVLSVLSPDRREGVDDSRETATGTRS
jgi:hypothetical protein